MTPSRRDARQRDLRPSVFRDARFLRLWTSTTLSGVATWALPFLLGLAVTNGTLLVRELGVLLAARTLGFLVAVPLGGLLADRVARHRVIVISGSAAAVASLALSASLGAASGVAIAAAAVIGAGQGACRPAFQALTADVVAPVQRQSANAAITLAVRVSVLLGPGSAALLSRVASLELLIAVTGAAWLATALLPPRAPAPTSDAPHPGLVPALAEGLAEARRHPWFLAGLGALTGTIALGYSATSVILPLISRDRYGGDWVLAGAMTAYPLGALVGAVLIARWRPRAAGWSALAGLALYAAAPLSLLVPVPAAVVLAAYAITGIGIELFNVPWFTAVQREVPANRLARVSSLDFLVSYGLAPVGLSLIAATYTRSPTLVLATCTAVCLLGPALAALAPGARHFSRAAPQSPDARTPDAAALVAGDPAPSTRSRDPRGPR